MPRKDEKCWVGRSALQSQKISDVSWEPADIYIFLFFFPLLPLLDVLSCPILLDASNKKYIHMNLAGARVFCLTASRKGMVVSHVFRRYADVAKPRVKR